MLNLKQLNNIASTVLFYHKAWREDEDGVRLINNGANDLEWAMRCLRKQKDKYGTKKILRLRKKYPNKNDRRKFKQRKCSWQFLRGTK
jgi:ribosomal protein S21